MNVDYRHWQLEDYNTILFDLHDNLHCKIIRTVLKPDEINLWNEWYGFCRGFGIELLAVSAKESGDLNQYTNYLFDYLQIGNEPFNTGSSSYTQTPGQLNRDLAQARELFPDKYIICAGLADGNPAKLDLIALNYVDAIAVHPGTETLESIDDYIAGYSIDKPLFITEFYHTELVRKLNNHPSVQAALFFCYDDVMVKPHGLLDHGVQKPEYHRFVQEANMADLNVGEGVFNEMANRNDKPIRDSEWHTNDNGTIYEKGYGELGVYEASNASGQFKIYFRPHYPLA